MDGWGVRLCCIALLGAAACSGSSSKNAISTTTRPAVATTTTTIAKPTTTTTSLPYSFTNSIPPPKLINTGTDYKAILLSMLEYANWIAAARPDMAYASKNVAPGSPSAKGVAHDVEVLTRDKRRLYEVNEGPATIEIISVKPDAVSARVIQRLRRQVIVDPSGTVINQRVFDKPTTTYNVLLVKLSDGRWYLASAKEATA